MVLRHVFLLLLLAMMKRLELPKLETTVLELNTVLILQSVYPKKTMLDVPLLDQDNMEKHVWQVLFVSQTSVFRLLKRKPFVLKNVLPINRIRVLLEEHASQSIKRVLMGFAFLRATNKRANNVMEEDYAVKMGLNAFKRVVKESVQSRVNRMENALKDEHVHPTWVDGVVNLPPKDNKKAIFVRVNNGVQADSIVLHLLSNVYAHVIPMWPPVVMGRFVFH